MAQNDGTIPNWTTGWRMQRSLSFGAMSVEEIAAELGVSRSTVSRWLNDRGTPSRGYLRLWAQLTGVPQDWLTYGDSPKLPRVDSNHQPAGSEKDPRPITRAEIHSLQKILPIRVATVARSASSQ